MPPGDVGGDLFGLGAGAGHGDVGGGHAEAPFSISDSTSARR